MSTEVREIPHPISRNVRVRAINCDIMIKDYDDRPNSKNTTKVIVSNIQPSGTSMLYFESDLPLAEQNWFHFRKGEKNKYFDNKVRLNPTGTSGIKQSFIQFTQEPNYNNTNTGNREISTTFDIVNENGSLNDPTLVIEW
jgi:hypothetical protein